MSNILSQIFGCGIWPLLIGAVVGLFIGWLLFRGKKQAGDLSIEGEGQLRAEADALRARVNELEGESGDLKGKLAAAVAGAATGAAAVVATGDKDDDETYALEWRNRYLAARVKYLEGRITDTAKPATKKAAPKKATAKKAPAKKATAKKTATKKVVAKKPAAKKPATKKTAAKKPATKKPVAKPASLKPAAKVVKKAPTKKATAKKAPAKKAAAKKTTKPASPNAKYLAEVRKYDAKASAAVVDNIVKYCGIALRSRDSSLVACSQEHELDTIAKGFATKKLGMKTGQIDLVKDVCGQMKGQRFKNRVTFYYLMAKKARKMVVFK